MKTTCIIFLWIAATVARLSDSDCGKRPASRIINGKESIANTWPWQASLHNEHGSQICGGTLISGQWILTGARCVTNGVAQVTLGKHVRVMTPEATEQIVKVAKVIAYSSSDYVYGINDIALLKLDKEVTFTTAILPACLPENSTDFDTSKNECWISGWGGTEDGRSAPREMVLHDQKVNIAPNDICVEAYPSQTIYGHVCVGNATSGGCQGDIGGPLSCRSSQDNKWYVAGALTFGYVYCLEKPTVYTRVSQYTNWILETVYRNI